MINYHLIVTEGKISRIKRLPKSYDEGKMWRYIEDKKIDGKSTIVNVVFENEVFENYEFLKIYQLSDNIWEVLIITPIELFLGMDFLFEDEVDAIIDKTSVEIHFDEGIPKGV